MHQRWEWWVRAWPEGAPICDQQVGRCLQDGTTSGGGIYLPLGRGDTILSWQVTWQDGLCLLAVDLPGWESP